MLNFIYYCMAGATKRYFVAEIIIASTWMLIAGYIGESFNPEVEVLLTQLLGVLFQL